MMLNNFTPITKFAVAEIMLPNKNSINCKNKIFHGPYGNRHQTIGRYSQFFHVFAGQLKAITSAIQPLNSQIFV